MTSSANAGRLRTWLVWILLAAVLAEGGLLGVQWFRNPARARALSPVLRGEVLARQNGCFACHGPGGTHGVPNPGSPFGEVPAWVGGTYMMFNESPAEIREWILDGAPKRLRDDPDYLDRRKSQKIWMPAFKAYISDSQADDLTAYVQSVSAAFEPAEGSAAARGRELAVEHGCFSCHGPEGRGLLANPGSFKGYIPAWDSADYGDLVRDPGEFREWIAKGEIARLRSNPAAAHFLDGQAIKMPAFEKLISDGQADDLRAYVEWVRARPEPAP